MTTPGRARVERNGNGLPGLRERVYTAEPAVPRPERVRERQDSLLENAAPVGRARVKRKGNGLPGLRKCVSPPEQAVPRFYRGRERSH